VRPDLTIDTEKVAADLKAFVRDYVEGADAAGVVLGLSGGLDSATAACVAVGALGPPHVWPLILPYRTSSTESRRDAERVADALRLQAAVLDVTAQVDAYFGAVGEASPLRVGNKVARERMSVLYDQAKSRGALVLGTGNRTERLLGYTTLWGDMACDLAPLGGLLKTQVRMLARALGVPKEIIGKPPTADLWPGQTDEDELGLSYETADELLHLLVDRRLAQRDIVAHGYDREVVRRVRKLMRRTAHKRRLPPSPSPPWRRPA